MAQIQILKWRCHMLLTNHLFAGIDESLFYQIEQIIESNAPEDWSFATGAFDAEIVFISAKRNVKGFIIINESFESCDSERITRKAITGHILGSNHANGYRVQFINSRASRVERALYARTDIVGDRQSTDKKVAIGYFVPNAIADLDNGELWVRQGDWKTDNPHIMSSGRNWGQIYFNTFKLEKGIVDKFDARKFVISPDDIKEVQNFPDGLISKRRILLTK